MVVDPGDPRLDDFRDLADAERRPDGRGLVIAEGVSVVERLLTSPYPVRAVAGGAAKLGQLAPALRQAGVRPLLVDKWVLSDAVGFRVTRGVLGSADRVRPPEAAELLDQVARVAVLEELNDFENLGALFRNAAALGVQAVLLDPRTADPLYRRSVRVSMGHVLRVPFARLPGQWPQSLGRLRARGFEVLALTPRPEAAPLGSFPPPRRWAVLLGAEGPGLSAGALGAADRLVRIPLADGVDSLNVATAAALAFAALRG
ncbi:MAG: RNA methyltransferase [Actinomycetota bacterium]|nr:RNA methyltransferase [Actinomycetota bacterium]